MLALDEFLPAEFAHRGRRLVYSEGIIVLAFMAGALLTAFGGITDRLIPLFAVGAFSAFTLSQFGMVAHWRRHRQGHWRRSLALNAAGGTATGLTLIVIVASKFLEGAWLTLLVIPLLLFLYSGVRHYQERLDKETNQAGVSKLDTAGVKEVLIVIPLKRLDRVAEKALRLALGMSGEIIAVQILAEEMKTEELPDAGGSWSRNPRARPGASLPASWWSLHLIESFTAPYSVSFAGPRRSTRNGPLPL
jgi:hypothetical protein